MINKQLTNTLIEITSMDHLNAWYDVFVLLNFKSQLAFVLTNSNIKNNIFITNLYDVDPEYTKQLSPKILSMEIFQKITALRANYRIRNVSHLKHLKKLYTDCNITHAGITGLDLEVLNLFGNELIYDVSAMRNLKILVADNSGLTQHGIRGLDLHSLSVDRNWSINDVRFMRNLKILYAESGCALQQDGIAGLDLHELYVGHNYKIYDVSFMRNLKVLRASSNCEIDDSGIRGLDLYVLNVDNNTTIHDISFMHNLKVLHARGNSAITSKNIEMLNIVELHVLCNTKFPNKLQYKWS